MLVFTNNYMLVNVFMFPLFTATVSQKHSCLVYSTIHCRNTTEYEQEILGIPLHVGDAGSMETKGARITFEALKELRTNGIFSPTAVAIDFDMAVSKEIKTLAVWLMVQFCIPTMPGERYTMPNVLVQFCGWS
jgi:hypothetical protein